mmetsp:Transcript_1070/g.2958  ORF Transcript_1070/g.2958 Transcript_1070/m.2958 type:complete len:166 (+) Transcript_1070:596-1093(+)
MRTTAILAALLATATDAATGRGDATPRHRDVETGEWIDGRRRRATPTVHVTRRDWASITEKALDAARPVWESVDRSCVLTITAARPAAVHIDPAPWPGPRLCRVDTGVEVDAEKTAIMALVDRPSGNQNQSLKMSAGRRQSTRRCPRAEGQTHKKTTPACRGPKP